MAKIAIVTDSNSGITQAEAEKLGIYVLPMPFMIGGETFFEGVNLTQEEFYRKLRTGVPVSTSQPAPDSVLRLWRRLLLDYDQVVHIPMSSGLSGSCQTAVMLADDFDGRVQVVNNQRISVTGVSFDDLTLADWEAARLGQIEAPFTFEDFDILDS